MHFLGESADLVERLRQPLPHLAEALAAANREWGDMTLTLGAKAQQDVEEVACAAVDYLFYSSYCVLAYCWGRMAETAAARQAEGADDFLAGKLAVADFFFARLLPRRLAHKAAIEAGPATLATPDEAHIGAL
jgi:hypothetical protein